MEKRLVLLTHLVASISPWNVWDLPWWLWCRYAALVDGWVSEQQERAAQMAAMRARGR